LRLAWTDEEGRDFAVKFNDDAKPRIVEGCLVMDDTEGDETEITVLHAVTLTE
jgi:hypothetical protein